MISIILLYNYLRVKGATPVIDVNNIRFALFTVKYI